MLQMIQYQNGEVRVIDRERMIASDFLWSGEVGSRLEAYELDFALAESDLSAPYTVVRDSTGYQAQEWLPVPDTGRKLTPPESEYLGELTYELRGGHRADPVQGSSVADVQARIDAARAAGARHVRWSRNDNAFEAVDAADLRGLGE